MKWVNRSALLVTPRRPFIEWVNRCGTTSFSGGELTAPATAFLVDEMEDVDQLVQKHWDAMFRHELGRWFPEESRWPTSRTSAMFLQWFDVTCTSTVVDLESDSLRVLSNLGPQCSDATQDELTQQALLEAVETQLRDGDPPEARAAFERLRESGASPDRAKQILARVFSAQMDRALVGQADPERYLSDLRALPDTLDEVLP